MLSISRSLVCLSIAVVAVGLHAPIYDEALADLDDFESTDSIAESVDETDLTGKPSKKAREEVGKKKEGVDTKKLHVLEAKLAKAKAAAKAQTKAANTASDEAKALTDKIHQNADLLKGAKLEAAGHFKAAAAEDAKAAGWAKAATAATAAAKKGIAMGHSDLQNKAKSAALAEAERSGKLQKGMLMGELKLSVIQAAQREAMKAASASVKQAVSNYEKGFTATTKAEVIKEALLAAKSVAKAAGAAAIKKEHVKFGNMHGKIAVEGKQLATAAATKAAKTEVEKIAKDMAGKAIKGKAGAKIKAMIANMAKEVMADIAAAAAKHKQELEQKKLQKEAPPGVTIVQALSASAETKKLLAIMKKDGPAVALADAKEDLKRAHAELAEAKGFSDSSIKDTASAKTWVKGAKGAEEKALAGKILALATKCDGHAKEVITLSVKAVKTAVIVEKKITADAAAFEAKKKEQGKAVAKESKHNHAKLAKAHASATKALANAKHPADKKKAKAALKKHAKETKKVKHQEAKVRHAQAKAASKAKPVGKAHPKTRTETMLQAEMGHLKTAHTRLQSMVSEYSQMLHLHGAAKRKMLAKLEGQANKPTPAQLAKSKALIKAAKAAAQAAETAENNAFAAEEKALNAAVTKKEGEEARELESKTQHQAKKVAKTGAHEVQKAKKAAAKKPVKKKAFAM